MAISIVRLGTARAREEGPRLGTVRRPPRGVPKSDYARQNYYDVWLPNLAPSAALMADTNVLHDRSRWPAFARRYEAELKQPDASRLLDTLAVLSHTADFALGCYCEDERFCHRSILRKALAARGAAIRA
ncbi:MAG TPA: DUF488 family protein [Vicinamibacterales bacterium]|jgi:uncharacterized protein YeaO (DUF488 family)|nr:DUF488 family protein [Vicinamibacterales bacterium]